MPLNEDSYNVVWQDYPDHLKEMLHNMINNKDFTDVTLVCNDGHEVQAHKAVLSACSPVFKKMLSNRLSFIQPIVFLKGINHEELQFLLQFAYLGQTTFHQTNLKNFLEVASSLQIKELSNDRLADEMEIQPSNKTFTQEDDTNNKHKKSKVDSEPIDKRLSQDIMNKVDDEKTETVTMKEENMNDLDICPICKSEFSNKIDLKEHYKSSHNVKKAGNKVGNEYQCSSCAYITKQPNKLAQHFQLNHQDRMYKCSICEFKVKDRSLLKDHIEKEHKEKKSDLSIHKLNEHKVKTSNKQYACFICQFKAPEKENLKHHISTEHTEDLEKLGSQANV